MKHAIELTQGPPAVEEMATAISNCVHCGFCLPVCPTYHVMGEELDSPRGRIFLMKEALENQLPVAEVMPYVDRCLGCMACVTACPSGVEYGELLSPFRAMAEEEERLETDRFGPLRRRMALETLPYPRRLRWALALSQWTRPLHGAVPRGLRPLTNLAPRRIPRTEALPPVLAPVGEVRARVALLTGCAQSVLAPDLNWATARILQCNGVEVVPTAQVCCGALDMHAGRAEHARAHALALCEALPTDVDAILTNAAGCGSGMHEYPLLFKDAPGAERARQVASKTQDVSRFLAQLGDLVPLRLPEPLRVAYHDACHLQHAQKVAGEPRALLEQVEGLTLVELGDEGFCCGSAGIYNVEHPEAAAELGQLKAQAVVDSQADVLATGNIGCLTQVGLHLQNLGSSIPVQHTMQVLARGLPASTDR